MDTLIFPKTISSIGFYFDTQKSQVRIDTLTAILGGIQQSVNALSHLSGGEDVPVYMGEVKPGSLLVEILISLPLKEIYLSVVGGVILEYLRHGPKGQQNGNIVINVGYGSVQFSPENYPTADQLRDREVLEGVAKVLVAAAADEDVRGIAILPNPEGSRPPFTVTKSEVKDAAQRLKTTISEIRRLRKTTTRLQESLSVAPDRVTRETSKSVNIQFVGRLAKGTIWKSVFEGFPIRAPLEQRAQGALIDFPNVRPGDVVTVSLRILELQDLNSETWAYESFAIEDILGHHPQPRPRLNRLN